MLEELRVGGSSISSGQALTYRTVVSDALREWAQHGGRVTSCVEGAWDPRTNNGRANSSDRFHWRRCSIRHSKEVKAVNFVRHSRSLVRFSSVGLVVVGFLVLGIASCRSPHRPARKETRLDRGWPKANSAFEQKSYTDDYRFPFRKSQTRNSSTTTNSA